MKFMVKLSYLAVLLLLSISLVSAALSSPCVFDGAVHLNGSDLANYTSDQIGCGVQRMSAGADIIIISVFGFGVLIFVYGLYKRK